MGIAKFWMKTTTGRSAGRHDISARRWRVSGTLHSTLTKPSRRTPQRLLSATHAIHPSLTQQVDSNHQ